MTTKRQHREGIAYLALLAITCIFVFVVHAQFCGRQNKNAVVSREVNTRPSSVSGEVAREYSSGRMGAHKMIISPNLGSTRGFSRVYAEKIWLKEGSECLSGNSDPSRIHPVLSALASVIDDFEINSMVDLPCGDMCYMASFLRAVLMVKPGFSYLGADVVPELIAAHTKQFSSPSPSWGYPTSSLRRHSSRQIRFALLDATARSPPASDLLYSRAMTQHLCTLKPLASCLFFFAVVSSHKQTGLWTPKK